MKAVYWKRRVTPAEKAAYLDTEVCRVYGHTPVGWRHDHEGVWLCLRPRKEAACKEPASDAAPSS